MKDRFIHEGRTLSDWLLQLIDDSSAKRRAASKVIVDQFYMPVSLLMQAGAKTEAIVAPFHEAVRNVVRSSQFPVADFVIKLFTLSIALEQERTDVWRAKDKEESAWHEEQGAKLKQNPTEAELRKYLKRVCIRIRKDCRDLADSLPDEAFETGITIAWVIDSLGEELLPAAPLLRFMLKETHQANIASEAISRMGGAAVEFQADLVSGLQWDDPNCYFAKPLGCLMRHMPSLIQEVLAKVEDPNEKVRKNAIMALGHCGREPLRKFPLVETALLAHMGSCSDEEWFACASSLGELAISLRTESLMMEATFLSQSDRVGTAIYCLGRMGMAPDIVVPRLLDLLKTFEEYDPDWCYTGSHARVVGALRGFGSHACKAIPLMIQRVWSKPQQYYDSNSLLRERPEPDESVIELLGSLGAAAQDALPVLAEVRTELIRRALEDREEEDLQAEIESEDDLCPEYLIEAIQSIRSTDRRTM